MTAKAMPRVIDEFVLSAKFAWKENTRSSSDMLVNGKVGKSKTKKKICDFCHIQMHVFSKVLFFVIFFVAFINIHKNIYVFELQFCSWISSFHFHYGQYITRINLSTTFPEIQLRRYIHIQCD